MEVALYPGYCRSYENFTQTSLSLYFATLIRNKIVKIPTVNARCTVTRWLVCGPELSPVD